MRLFTRMFLVKYWYTNNRLE